MQGDEESVNYNFHPYDIPIGELLDSEGEGETFEEKPRLGLVPDELDGPQEMVDLEAECSKVARRGPKRKVNMTRKKMKLNIPGKRVVEPLKRRSKRKKKEEGEGEKLVEAKDSEEQKSEENFGENVGGEAENVFEEVQSGAERGDRVSECQVRKRSLSW